MPGEGKLLFTMYKFMIENEYMSSEMRVRLNLNGQQKRCRKDRMYKRY